MAPLSTLSILGLAATALALPHTGQSGHGSHFRPTGTHFKPSGTGVRSHHLPSGTKASSGVRVHSHHHSHSAEAVVASAVESIASIIPAQYNAVDTETEACSTVTTKIRVTVTVTAEESHATVAAASSSSLASSSATVVTSSSISSSAVVLAPSSSSSSAVEVAPTIASYFASVPAYAGSKAAAESTTAAVSSIKQTTSSIESTTTQANKAHVPVISLPVFSIPAVSIPALVPTTTAHTYLSVSSAATITTAVAASSAIAYSGGKRGLAYNTASLAAPFVGSNEVSWAYNWGSSSSGLSNSFKYIPTLWGTDSKFTSSWVKNAGDAIKAGSTHLFSFNEPDLAAQADLTPAAAATAYKSWVSDNFGGQNVKLCAPSVTNGYDPTNTTLIGLEWLKSFMIECKGCQIDCVNIHWYGTEASDLKKHVQDTINVAGGKEIWFTEFGLNGNPSSSTVSSFLEDVMPYLDSVSQVAGYAYFMLSQGVLSSGSTLNTAGLTYMSYAG